MKTVVSNAQLENENSLRKYPLSDGATGIDDDGNQLPPDIVVDIAIVCLNRLDSIRIASVFVSQEIVSASIASEQGAVAVITVPRQNASGEHTMTSLMEGITAKISFGVSELLTQGSYRFSSAVQSSVHEYCIFEFPVSGVVEFVDPVSGNTATGTAVLVFSDGAELSVKDRDKNKATVVIGVTDGISRSLSNGCMPTDLNESCAAPVIRSINGIEPGDNGEIAVILE